MTKRGRSDGATANSPLGSAVKLRYSELYQEITEINGRNGWTATTAMLDKGVLLRVTASNPKEVSHIRGLGFIGVLVSGSHHQPHHLAMAKGEPIHAAGADHAQHVH